MTGLRHRASAWIVAAAIIGAVAALLALRAAADGGPRDTVIVAARPIAAGTVLGVGDPDAPLRSVAVPADLPVGGFIGSPEAVAGRRTVVPLAEGEPVTVAVLGGGPGSGPAPLRAGERAVAVPLAAAGSAAPSLRPGVRVDAVASTGDRPAGRSEVVVADAEVLAVDGASVDSQLLSGSVMVRVSEDDALGLTEALNFAREVRLLIRPLGEPAGG